MKNLILFSAFTLTVFLAFTFPEKLITDSDLYKTAQFMWESTLHDFGAIEKDNPVSHTFEFTNDGEVPLIITKVKGSCGCTVTEYSKGVLAPGETGFVKATYNAKAIGQFNKSVTVTANVEGGPERLIIKGEVLQP